MKRTQGRALSAAIIALGVAVAIVPLAIYNLIETADMHGMHGMAMACEGVCTASAVMGAGIAVAAAASLIFKNAKLGLTASTTLLVGGVAVIVVPRVIGFCESADMACRYITEPTLAILGSAIIVLSLVRLVTGVVAIRKASEAA
jgi:hypothetical protein